LPEYGKTGRSIYRLRAAGGCRRTLGSLNDLDLDGIDWVIYGGESGRGFCGEDKQWARDMHSK
jgi:protein gp37